LKTRILAGAAVAALSLAVAVAIPAAPAFAAGTGTLVVELVTPWGAPIDVSGLAIYTYDTVGSPVFFAQESESNASGVITVPDVPAGKINTEAPPQNGYAFVQKNGLRIAAGKTLTIKLVLAKGGIIKGLVTNGLTSEALEGANVEVLDSSGNEVSYGVTNGDGSYSVDSLPTGKYRVQFNSKKEPVTGDTAQTLSWSYWRGTRKTSTTSWTSAETISVKQQGARSAPQTVSNIDGSVLAGDTVDGTVSYWSPEASHAGQEVTFIGKHNGDSFTTVLGDDGNLSVPVNPGEYRIAIQGDADPIDGDAPNYWYVSDTTGPSDDESDATWVTVNSLRVVLDFIAKPAPTS
jgi:Carboxypeptidase regulatory-like domain